MKAITRPATRTQSARLARAEVCGYVLTTSPRDPLRDAYWCWCNAHRRPFVCVTVRGRYAEGELDFEPTAHLSNDPRVGLQVEHLSTVGAAMMRTFFDAHGAPHTQLLNCCPGSAGVIMSRVPTTEADALGATLYLAATGTLRAGSDAA